MTTNDYLRSVRDRGWPVLRGKLWQRNYYEHIIRNPQELDIIREYIATKPLRWSTDPENHLQGRFMNRPYKIHDPRPRCGRGDS